VVLELVESVDVVESVVVLDDTSEEVLDEDDDVESEQRLNPVGLSNKV
jgi:hypothetical protein